MKRALNYLWRGWMVLLAGILLILFFIPVYLLSIKKEHYKYAYFFVRLWCKGVFYGMGFRYELINKILFVLLVKKNWLKFLFSVLFIKESV